MELKCVKQYADSCSCLKYVRNRIQWHRKGQIQLRCPVADHRGPTRTDLVEIARIRSQTGSQLTFDQLSTGLRHAHDMHTQVCDLDSVMEFGLK